MKTIEITLRLSEYEIQYIQREYRKKGLGVELPGNNPNPVDLVIKTIAEESWRNKK